MRPTVLPLVLLASLTAAQVTSPPKGSPLRKTLLDALRPAVQRELKTPVEFQVQSLRVQGDWAFLFGAPQRKGGGRVDYSRTKYGQAQQQGMFDDNISALFRRRGRAWKVVRYVIGATDVVYLPWPKQYGAPKGIFPGQE